MLKAYRLRMIRKQDGKGICVYNAAETEAEARRFFEESFCSSVNISHKLK